jgi:hypothetical protein
MSRSVSKEHKSELTVSLVTHLIESGRELGVRGAQRCNFCRRVNVMTYVCRLFLYCKCLFKV